jgi:hypothetical protein
MGREATCAARVGAESAEVKALLESSELILRGGFKRRYAIAGMRELQVLGDELQFQASGEQVALALGAAQATSWARKIATPAPTLAAKLGIAGDRPAYVFGNADDPALAAALTGASTSDAQRAHLLIAVLRSEADLEAAVELHAGMPCAMLWAVVPKGRGAVPSDASVRRTLRERGYVDSKTAAVSATLTATRYGRR